MYDKKDLITRRTKWLDDEEITIPQFAKAAKLGYDTAYAILTTEREPIKPYKKTILKAFPDFPIK